MRRRTSVWIYGSFARGDADHNSDVDVLIAGDDCLSWCDVVGADATLAALIRNDHQLSPMQFGWGELDAMAAYGSLFLHHVKLEGRPLTPIAEDSLTNLLNNLPPYRRAMQEIRAFGTVLQDVEHSVSVDHSPNFELAVIAAALRHAFILGCYVTGQPDFGRVTPFRRLSSELELPSRTLRDLESLYQFRLYQQSRAPAPFDATTEDVREWLRVAATLFAAIHRRVDDFDRTVH